MKTVILLTNALIVGIEIKQKRVEIMLGLIDNLHAVITLIALNMDHAIVVQVRAQWHHGPILLIIVSGF